MRTYVPMVVVLATTLGCPAADGDRSKGGSSSGGVTSAEDEAPAAAATAEGGRSAGVPGPTAAKPTARPKPALPEEGKPVTRAEAERGLRALMAFVRGGATDPTNAWAMAHGLTGLGADLEASDGREVIDVLVSDYARLEDVDGKRRLIFPPKAADGAPVEPHRDLIVKSMLEAGVPLTRQFTLRTGEKVTLADFVRDLKAGFSVPADDKGWHDFAWSYGALMAANEAPPSDPAEVVAIQTLSYVEQQQGFLEALMDEGRPDKVDKRKQLIYSHTCGGLHLVQTAMAGIARTGKDDSKARARKQLDVVIFRWTAERALYRRMRKAAPEYGLILLVQELKFYGHVLETLTLAHESGLYPVDEASREVVSGVTRDLLDTIYDLGEAYGRLPEIRKMREQTYLDMIGDGCHAIRGLRQALVAFFAAS